MNQQVTPSKATDIFREAEQCEDCHDEVMCLYSTAERGCMNRAADTIPLLSTFSCESVDEDSMNGLGVTRKNCFAADEDSWSTTDLPAQHIAKRRKTISKAVFQPSIVVTPERSQRPEISLDPSPLGYELPPESLELNGVNAHLRSKAVEAEKDHATALLFPLINNSPFSNATCAIPEIRPSLLNYHDEKCRDGNLDCSFSSKRMDAVQSLKIPQDLLSSDVYKFLRPSLPLPKLLRAVLCLLLHLEYSSSTTTITQCETSVLLKSACGTVNDKLLEREIDDSLDCGTRKNTKTSINKVDRTKTAKKSKKNVSGTIFDALVERLGSSVDLAILFQASAQTNNHFSATNDRRLEVFFHPRVSNNTSEQHMQKCASRETTTSIGDANQQFCFTPASSSVCNIGDTRKECAKACNHDDDNEIRSEFKPTMLQLAVAFGAQNCRVSMQAPTSDCSMNLEDFVKRVSKDLESMDEKERACSWNTLLTFWENHFKEI